MPAGTSPARRSRSAAGRATWFKISSFLGGGDMKTIPSVAALLLAVALSSAHAQKVIRVWHTETQPNSQEAVRNIAKRFEAKHPGVKVEVEALDRKSTRLNSSHGYISYAVFCLKKKNNKTIQ